jgi:uncharacterized protein with von Willebrand factor type A (vWA) domain
MGLSFIETWVAATSGPMSWHSRAVVHFLYAASYAKARGIREILPHVDSFRAGHNIASLQALADALTKPEDVGEKARLMRAMREG